MVIGMVSAVVRNQAFLYTNEASPTNFRGIFVGTACFLGKNGAALAPFIINWLEANGKDPGSSFALASIIGIVFVLCGRETFGKDLSLDQEDEDEDHFHELELEMEFAGDEDRLEGECCDLKEEVKHRHVGVIHACGCC